MKIGEPDYANQTRCFEGAARARGGALGRPVAVHCVRAYGDMGDIFRAGQTFPPRVLMHSYGGTAAFLESLTRMKRWGPRFYFGFSSAVNLAARRPKTSFEPCPPIVCSSSPISSRQRRLTRNSAR